jgi:hypothetical protein
MPAVPLARAGVAPMTSITHSHSQDAPERVRDQTRCNKCERTDEQMQGTAGKDPTRHDMHDMGHGHIRSIAIEPPLDLAFELP